MMVDLTHNSLWIDISILGACLLKANVLLLEIISTSTYFVSLVLLVAHF